MKGIEPRRSRSLGQRGQGAVTFSLVLVVICLVALFMLGLLRLVLDAVFAMAAR